MATIQDIRNKYSTTLFLGECNASDEIAGQIGGLASLLTRADHSCGDDDCSRFLTPQIKEGIERYATLASTNAEFAKAYGPVVWELQQHFGLGQEKPKASLPHARTGSSNARQYYERINRQTPVQPLSERGLKLL